MDERIKKGCKMNADDGIVNIAINLTSEEFKGYCKGMEIAYLLRASRGKNKSSCGRRVAFWMGAYDKFKHHCKS